MISGWRRLSLSYSLMMMCVYRCGWYYASLPQRCPSFTGVKHGHTPLSRALRATRAWGNVLYEINIQPAREVWKNETAEAAGYHDFAAILIFDCAVRQLMLVDNFGESVARVKRVPARCTHSGLGDVW